MVSASPHLRNKPRALRPGDKVGIVAPASNVKRDMLEAGCEGLRRAGYEPFYFESILDRDLYFAGSVERRARELEDMFVRDDIRAIVCARGGYGSNYLPIALDPNKIVAHPKILVGYSDITTLVCCMADSANFVTFHGPMAAKDFAIAGGVDVESWQNALGGAANWSIAEGSGARPMVPGEAEGILYGGCLSMLVASLGTEHEVRTAGTILFIEDIFGEALPDRSHADAIETGGQAKRCARHGFRRNAGLQAESGSGLHAGRSDFADCGRFANSGGVRAAIGTCFASQYHIADWSEGKTERGGCGGIADSGGGNKRLSDE